VESSEQVSLFVFHLRDLSGLDVPHEFGEGDRRLRRRTLQDQDKRRYPGKRQDEGRQQQQTTTWETW
jgi:hypothetical protein